MGRSLDTQQKSVVFITGCSDGGIGAALALEFARHGFHVVATARSLNSMKELSKNDRIHPIVLDVTDFQAAKATVESIVAEHGHIDVLVNNAGVPCIGPVAEIPLSSVESTFKTNVFGPIVLVQAVVPHMIARGKGRIVNIGSIVTLAYGPWGGAYNGSKAALEAFTDALRLEMKPFGIQVVLILPGAITTNIGPKAVTKLESGSPEGLKLYNAFRSDMLYAATVTSGTKQSTSGEQFARKVVPRILARSPPAHYAYGHFATLFLVLYYIPLGLRDYIWTKYYKLDRKVSVTDRKTD